MCRPHIIKSDNECLREVECVMRCKIRFQWDEEAAVWIATSDDVPGLVLESGSFDALVERVKLAVPELLKLNGVNML